MSEPLDRATVERWRDESRLWTGDDYLWLNRYRSVSEDWLRQEEAYTDLLVRVAAGANNPVLHQQVGDWCKLVLAAHRAALVPQAEEENPRECFDLFHSQSCSGFGAPDFCGSCGESWKHHRPQAEEEKP